MARRISLEAGERMALTLEINALVNQIAACDASLEKLFGEIARRVEAHPVGVKLLEMHGIGAVIAGVLVSELLPVARAATEAQSATYAGVTPLGRKSGKSLDTSQLTQGVNKRILHALYTFLGRRDQEQRHRQGLLQEVARVRRTPQAPCRGVHRAFAPAAQGGLQADDDPRAIRH
jgi:transposase